MSQTIGELLGDVLEGEPPAQGGCEGMIASSVRDLLPEDLQGRSEDVALLVAHALHPTDSTDGHSVLTGWATRVEDALALPEEHPARRLTEELQALRDTLKAE